VQIVLSGGSSVFGYEYNGQYVQENFRMNGSNIELTQFLLDRHSPGHNARTILAQWDMALVNNTMPDIHVFKFMLYDGFSQSSFDKSPKRALINQADFLLDELMFRYIDKVLGHEFVSKSKSLSDQAYVYKDLSSDISRQLQHLKSKFGNSAMHNSLNTTLEAFDPLLRDVYLLADTNRILRDTGEKTRELYFGNEPSIAGPFDVPGAQPARNNPFRIPAFDEIRERREQAQFLVDQMDDKELCLRLIRSFSETSQAKLDPTTPVYGVKTLYAYIPLVMNRLMSEWSYDNLRVMEDLSSKMSESTTQLLALKNRIDRVMQANDQRQVEYIAERFGDGECAIFAMALHQATGLPLVVFEVSKSNDPALPVGFPRHAAVQMGDNQYLDAFGLANLKDIETRFNCKLRVETQPDVTKGVFEPQWQNRTDEDITEARKFASEMIKLKGIQLSSAQASRLRRHIDEDFEP
jgi:hypothetical protein